jgi:DNA-binding transcriptional MerR regulator
MTTMYWYTKEFSKLTRVTMRTLYHYDKIGLLVPSVRLRNSYRKYSELDLLKLQQIIALKSFGFGLRQIKSLVSEKMNLSERLNEQAKFLEEKAYSLMIAAKVLKSIIVEDSESINWEQTLTLIEVYRMIEQLKDTWIGKALNDDELREYAQFEQELASRGEEQKISFNKKWEFICQEIKKHLISYNSIKNTQQDCLPHNKQS